MMLDGLMIDGKRSNRTEYSSSTIVLEFGNIEILGKILHIPLLDNLLYKIIVLLVLKTSLENFSNRS